MTFIGDESNAYAITGRMASHASQALANQEQLTSFLDQTCLLSGPQQDAGLSAPNVSSSHKLRVVMQSPLNKVSKDQQRRAHLLLAGGASTLAA